MNSHRLQVASAIYGVIDLIIYFAILMSCGMPGAAEQCDARAQTQSTWFAVLAGLFYLTLAWFAPRERK